jgi:hypothetical protein
MIVERKNPMKYQMRTLDGWLPVVFATRMEAERALRTYATERGLALHLHPVEYSDGAVSTAYVTDGDPFFNAETVVLKTPPQSE